MKVKRHTTVRWALSQFVALLFRTRRFISLSLPTSRNHRIFDINRKSFLTISGRGAEDLVSIVQVFIAEFYNLERLGKRYQDIVMAYNMILRSGKTPLIIDCGANIGLTALYFSMCFPQAKIVAIEPDNTNCRFAVTNTNSHDVDVQSAAVGGESGSCKIVDFAVTSNSFRVEVDPSGSNLIPLVTVDDVIREYGDSYTPFIIKIDVEGFEKHIFETNTSWIRRFPLLIIELHDWMLPKEANSANFLKAIARENRDFVFLNENIFSINNN